MAFGKRERREVQCARQFGWNNRNVLRLRRRLLGDESWERQQTRAEHAKCGSERGTQSAASNLAPEDDPRPIVAVVIAGNFCG
jgi:hypothetical protein